MLMNQEKLNWSPATDDTAVGFDNFEVVEVVTHYCTN